MRQPGPVFQGGASEREQMFTLEIAIGAVAAVAAAPRDARPGKVHRLYAAAFMPRA